MKQYSHLRFSLSAPINPVSRLQLAADAKATFGFNRFNDICTYTFHSNKKEQKGQKERTKFIFFI